MPNRKTTLGHKNVMNVGIVIFCMLDCIETSNNHFYNSNMRVFYQACDKYNSDEFSAQGLKSLKVQLYPFDYPGVSFRKYEKNWEEYQAICFELYNPTNSILYISFIAY